MAEDGRSKAVANGDVQDPAARQATPPVPAAHRVDAHDGGAPAHGAAPEDPHDGGAPAHGAARPEPGDAGHAGAAGAAGHASRPMSLRSRILLAVIGLLALICLVIGLITHAVMQSALYAQVDEQLHFAAERAANFDQRTGAAGEHDPLDAPGQASGTLNARLLGNTLAIGIGGVLDPETGQRLDLSQLPQRDITAIASVAPNAAPVTVHLSLGDYRLVALRNDSVVGTLITGLPLEGTRDTLDSLSWTMLLVSVGGLAATALAGSLIIRRTLMSLERVSAVAKDVAELPLEAGEVRLAQRVLPADSVPGTESGNMGNALNALLENVESALEVRQESEAKMRRFVADASHELRTPLAAIRGYSELVAATEHLSDEGQRSLERVVEQSRRMGALVDNLLLLARLDEGHRPEFTEVDLTLLVTEAAHDFRVAAPGHNWRLALPSEPVLVRGNAGQLTRVLNNLLSNARKHTADGTTVTTSLARSADGRHAVLAVSDDGQGIAPDFLPTVFARFTRADAARSGADGTTGLGLPIVKAIVEAHGGAILVASRPGRTEFTVRLPLLVVAPPKPGQPPRTAAGRTGA